MAKDKGITEVIKSGSPPSTYLTPPKAGVGD